MEDAITAVKSGQVTYAVRDTSIDGKEIKTGDYMGIDDVGIQAVGQDITEVVKDLIGAMADEDSELLSIYYGSDVEEEKANALVEAVQAAYPDFEVEAHAADSQSTITFCLWNKVNQRNCRKTISCINPDRTCVLSDLYRRWKENMRKEDSIQTIKGIGEKTAESFARLGIFTIDDLLHTYPRNYLSYEEPVCIRDAAVGERHAIRAMITSYVTVKQVRSLKLTILTVSDGDMTMHMTWF